MPAGKYRLTQELPSNASTGNSTAGAAAAAPAVEVQWNCRWIDQGGFVSSAAADLEITVEEGQVVVCIAGQKEATRDQPRPLDAGELLCY
jgi:hypothetical protein